VTIDLPSDGVPVDRVVLPDSKNIRSIVVYYVKPKQDVLIAVNNEEVFLLQLALVFYHDDYINSCACKQFVPRNVKSEPEGRGNVKKSADLKQLIIAL